MKYIKNYAEIIAQNIATLTGYMTQVFPPVGLRASVGISAYDENANFKGYINLTVREKVVYYDTGKIIHKYPDGSIGELNGFGLETAPLPNSTEKIWEIMKIKEEN